MNNAQHTVVLVGAGQLGSRHLQGLAHIDIPLSIHVIDPSESSLCMARERYHEIETNPNISDIRFLTRMEDAPATIDLAVVATNANVRADVVRTLVKQSSIRHIILEKVLFQKEGDYKSIAELFHTHRINAVVNCPRRIYPFYRQLKQTLAAEGTFSFCVEGSNWGMGCNAIHFIDLFTFLSGDASLVVDAAALDDTVLESKRPGFVEFTGMLTGTNSRSDSFSIASLAAPGTPLSISIRTGKHLITIHESSGEAIFYDENSGESHHESFVVPYQSQLTGMVAREMILNGACGLTPYTESMQLHLPVINAFIGHLGKAGNGPYEYCPIT